MFSVAESMGSVLCCKCGILMQPNAATMCANCLRSQVDITEGLQKHVVMCYCPQCECYLQPPSTWIKAQLESRELLTLCVNRLKNLNTVRLVHAQFIWTEPHSKRIKIKLRVQKEVIHGAILEQAYTVEYVVQDQLCESCARVHANPDLHWAALVQLRQRVSHRRTFFYLEQLILKHDAAKDAIRIKQMDQGIDFFFGKQSHGSKFVDFVGKVVPISNNGVASQLVSHDSKSNKDIRKYTFSVEISPVCREDLVCLPHKVAASLGNLGPLVICHKVSSSIGLLDPLSLRQCFLDAKQYRRSSLKPLLSSRQLTEYIVLHVEPISSCGQVSKYILADAHVARVSDFGNKDIYFIVRTHLGHLLRPGDYALGYDLYGANSNDMELDKYKTSLPLPDVILIKKKKKKSYQEKPPKLKSLNMEGREYQHFLRDLEENPDLRFNLSLSEMPHPSVPLDDLLADLDLADADDDMAE